MKKEQIKEIIEDAGLTYIANYVAHKFKHKYPNLGCHTKDFSASSEKPDWV